MKSRLFSVLFLTTLGFAMDISNNLTEERMKLANDANKILSGIKFTYEWKDKERELFEILDREILPRLNKLVEISKQTEEDLSENFLNQLQDFNTIFNNLRTMNLLENIERSDCFEALINKLNDFNKFLLGFAID